MKTTDAKEFIKLLERCARLKSAPRFKSSLKHDGDTVAEHSWRLAVMVLVIAEKYNLKIDIIKAMAMALIHDLAEAQTGDIDAYEVMTGNFWANKKQQAEKKAIQNMTGDLKIGKNVRQLWEEYENQISLEAKFVKALDRMEAFLHIIESGIEDYIPQEFHGDYADKAVRAFDEASHHFPELNDLLNEIKKILKRRTKAAGVRWAEGELEQPKTV
ncbi:MAG: hypothetical protein A2538_00300 [Candidatus Magasanikbacteria bacterium RIFOXYD2_FULL_41_14]|uniref:5'-deoxynucleotidase n=1 Tax=Candidatus Magasanikbacteria bacterium RIFOXYD2_FULL_41_14 TaxID=1798709 RepID=A0A1F6PEJ8_9BACT|nr:MAG: hypothetical protein A2538_00300 [Candidatus Magasanikbacteria bacterium RIFOXYD2_FULL_41_14]